MRVIGVEVDWTSMLSVLDDVCVVVEAVEVTCGELVETAGVERPVVVAKAVSTSCESRNCPALRRLRAAIGKTVPIKPDVEVAAGVLVAVEVEVTVVDAGIASSRICTMFGGGKFIVVVAEVSGVEVADVVVAGVGGAGGVVVAVSGVLVGAGGVMSGVEVGMITGSGSSGVVVGVSAGGGGVTGVVLVGVVVGVIGTGVGVGTGGVTGKFTSCIGVWSSVEVDAASSMYAELFFEKLPNGACAGRSCVRAFSGESQPLPSTVFGKMCACFIS